MGQCPKGAHAWVAPHKRGTSAVRGFYVVHLWQRSAPKGHTSILCAIIKRYLSTDFCTWAIILRYFLTETFYFSQIYTDLHRCVTIIADQLCESFSFLEAYHPPSPFGEGMGGEAAHLWVTHAQARNERSTGFYVVHLWQRSAPKGHTSILCAIIKRYLSTDFCTWAYISLFM